MVQRESKKHAAMTFLQMVINGNIHEAYSTFATPDMRHHNPFFPGDAASLEKGMAENHKQFPNKLFDIQQTLEDGDLVAVHSHLRMHAGEAGLAVVHIFRFENNRIVEMWDIAQPVPKESPNVNGMF